VTASSHRPFVAIVSAVGLALLIVFAITGGAGVVEDADGLMLLLAAAILVAELFPVEIRALGVGLPYAVAVSLFGGTTQFIITWLIEVTGNPAAPAWYVAGTSVITVLAMTALPETRDRVLED